MYLRCIPQKPRISRNLKVLMICKEAAKISLIRGFQHQEKETTNSTGVIYILFAFRGDKSYNNDCCRRGKRETRHGTANTALKG